MATATLSPSCSLRPASSLTQCEPATAPRLWARRTIRVGNSFLRPMSRTAASTLSGTYLTGFLMRLLPASSAPPRAGGPANDSSRSTTPSPSTPSSFSWRPSPT